MSRIWDWAAYRKPITMEGGRSAGEVSEALAAMTRRWYFRGYRDGRRPLVGRIDGLRGSVRYQSDLVTVIARRLVFRLEDVDGGCVLRGHLEVIPFVRWFTGIYCLFCVVMSVVELVAGQVHAPGLDLKRELEMLVWGPLFGLIFMFGYNGFGVLLGRRSERRGLKVIQHVMASREAEAIVRDLLDSSR